MKNALVLIDVQNGFITDYSSSVIKVIEDLLKAEKERINPFFDHIIFTQFINIPGSPFQNLMKWNKMQSPPDTNIVSPLEDYASAVVEKMHTPLFAKTTNLIIT